MSVDGPQHHQTFHEPHLFRADLLLPGLVGRFRIFRQDLSDLDSAQLVNLFFVAQVRGQGTDHLQLSHQIGHVPVVGVAAGKVPVHDVLELLAEHAQDLTFEIVTGKNVVPVGVNDSTLVVQYIVIFQEVLPHVEVVAFDLHLGVADGLGNPFILNGGIFIHPGPAHQRLDAVSSETAHQFVFQGDIELGAARVALTPGPASELVVDAPGVVMLGANDV